MDSVHPIAQGTHQAATKCNQKSRICVCSQTESRLHERNTFSLQALKNQLQSAQSIITKSAFYSSNQLRYEVALEIA